MQTHLHDFNDWWKRAWQGMKTWRWDLFLEILLIIVWVLWMGRNLLNMNPEYYIFGAEVPLISQSHYIWEAAQECGLCVLWNGTMNGGYPSFAETHGAILHPLVVVTTIFWGVVNGSKMVVLGSLILAGIAQWWLANVMGLGRAARIWASLVAVVSGSLLGKMDGGGFLFILSQASASMIFAPIVGLYLQRKKSYTIWLGILLALTWVSGQGYIQIGVVMGVFPALLILILSRNGKISALWKDYAKAIILSLLLAGVLILPLAHFYPNFTKVADPYLTNLQPLASLPLNLVISDMKFFTTEVLGHDLMAYINYIFIGWFPVILAILSLYFVPKDKTRLMWFFWVVILLIFVSCSKEYVTFLHKYFPSIDTLRFFSVVSGMVVTPLLGLAAWSLDEILKKPLPKFMLSNSDGSSGGVSIKWIIWLAILIGSLYPLASYRLPWLDVITTFPRSDLDEKLINGEANWLAPIREDFIWVDIMLHKGIKQTNVYRPWEWKDKENPPATFSFILSPEVGGSPNEVARDGDVRLIKDPNIHYAFLTTPDDLIPCKAIAQGGYIDVSCTSPNTGKLTVQENYFSGWQLWVDGERRELTPDRWLSAPGEAGTHVYQFRYRPWDVLVGLLVTLAGVAFIAWLIIRDDKKEPARMIE